MAEGVVIAGAPGGGWVGSDVVWLLSKVVGVAEF